MNKLFKFNVTITGYISSSSPAQIEREITSYLRAWEDLEDFAVEDIHVDEVESDEGSEEC